MPTSSRLATRPLIATRPVLGSVMRDRILSSVILPAPLRPMMPTISPRLISKSTSLSAQNSSISAPVTSWRPRIMSRAERARPFAVRVDNVPQRGVAFVRRLVADQVFLAKTFRPDDDVAIRPCPRICVRWRGSSLRRTTKRK